MANKNLVSNFIASMAQQDAELRRLRSLSNRDLIKGFFEHAERLADSGRTYPRRPAATVEELVNGAIDPNIDDDEQEAFLVELVLRARACGLGALEYLRSIVPAKGGNK